MGTRRATAKFRVGDRVRVRYGTALVVGAIEEDRGNIGVGGRRLLRVRLQIDPENETVIELPVEELDAA